MTDADRRDTLHVIVYSLDERTYRRLAVLACSDGFRITPNADHPTLTRLATTAECAVINDLFYASPSDRPERDSPSSTGIA